MVSSNTSSSMKDRKRASVPSEVYATLKKRAKTGDFALRKLEEDARPVNYQDEIHDYLNVHPVMRELMDTEPFQRLREIKQLGTSYLVFPTGNHTRFEHSIGVAHLARQMVSRLKEKHTVLGTTIKDVLCVTLAGLLHDLGHGPFSHVFEVFRGELEEDLKKNPSLGKKYDKFPKVPDNWSHERSSLFMVDAALEELGLAIDMNRKNLDKPLKQIGDGVMASSMRVFFQQGTNEDILTNRDWIFIKECIYGKPIPEVTEKWGIDERIGRLESQKEWLYDIVANQHNGIDVDKIDYFARDQRRTIGESGKVNVLMVEDAVIAKAKCSKPGCKTCSGDGMHYMICYPEKSKKRIREFCQVRSNMHEKVYQHKTTNATACMIVDILKKADLHYLLPASDNKQLPISRAVIDKEAFLSLEDNIIHSIGNSTSEELKPARELAKRFKRRKLYKFAGELALDPERLDHTAFWTKAKKDPDEVAREIFYMEGTHADGNGDDVQLELDDVVIACSSWHHGQKDKDPASFVRFVDGRENCWGCLGDEIPVATEKHGGDYFTSSVKSFQQKCIRVFCRDSCKRKRDYLQHKLFTYLEWHGLAVRGGGDKEQKENIVNTAAAAESEAEEGYCGLQPEDDPSGDGNSDHSIGQRPLVPMTQDSCDEGTPMKGTSSLTYYEESPIRLDKIPDFLKYSRK